MSETLTRLQPGMRVLFAGAVHRVVMVNECRAPIVPVAKTVRTFVPKTGKSAGQRLVIESTDRGQNISPDSELEVVG